MGDKCSPVISVWPVFKGEWWELHCGLNDNLLSTNVFNPPPPCAAPLSPATAWNPAWATEIVPGSSTTGFQCNLERPHRSLRLSAFESPRSDKPASAARTRLEPARRR